MLYEFSLINFQDYFPIIVFKMYKIIKEERHVSEVSQYSTSGRFRKTSGYVINFN